jgi:hypothetical protein
MAGKLTNYAANAILDELTGRTATLNFSDVYVGLSTTEPTVSGGNITEPAKGATTGYNRILLGSNASSLTQLMNAATNGTTTNNQIIKFDEVLASWGTLTHFVLFNSKTGGSALAFGEILNDSGVATPITPAINSMPIIRAGGLTISLT